MALSPISVPAPNVTHGFCGEDTFYTIWKGNRFGLCFREIVLASLPYLILLIGGGARAFQIYGMRKKTKYEDIRVAGIKKTALQRRWFWTQFILCVCVVLLSQFQLLDAGLLPGTQPIPVVIVSDALRSLAWGFAALLIYFEYKKWLAHSGVIRVFYIVSFVANVIIDSSVIASALESGDFNAFVWSFQIMVLIQGILAIMGGCGFRRKFRKRFEPSIPETFLIKGDENGWSLKAMIMAAKPDALWWIIASLFAIGQGVATISFLEFTSDAITAIQENKPFEEFRNCLLWFAVAGVGAGVCAMGSGALYGVAGMRYVARLRVKLLNSLMIQEMAFFDTVSPGGLIGHMTSDTDKLADLKDFIPWFITPGCQVVFGAYTLFKTSWQLTIVVCALLVVEFLEASIRSKHVTHRYMSLYVKTNRGSSEKATEALASLITIRLFGQERREEENYARKANAAARIGIRKEVLESICQGIEVLLHATIVGLGTLYSYNLIEDGMMNKNGLQEFILVGVQLVASFQDVIKTTPLFAEVTGPAAIIINLIERIPKMDQLSGETPSSLQGTIGFKNLAFTYPSAHTRTFDDFSLEIPAGTSAAFVGPSGCGKSSLFKMVLRFYDPQQGDVKIDKHYNLRDLNLRWWLQNVGVVSQEPVLFKGTLRYNILYGLADQSRVTEEQIMEAIRRAHLTNLVQEKGLDYDVGDKGGNLSGGQKQRVCIARVFLRQPKILLLDEVTSALDPISEAEVMRALTELMKDRTTLVIAHRLHTIVDIDRIYVLKEGKIVDQGAHADLVKKEGFFREMWVKQQGERDTEAVADGADESQEQALRSWSDVDTLLDLLEQQGASTEITTLARRIRPPRTRLGHVGSVIPTSSFAAARPGETVLELSTMGDHGYDAPPSRRRRSFLESDDEESGDDRSPLLKY